MNGEILRRTAKTYVIDGDGDFLTIRRSQHIKHRPGTWDFAGGKAEQHETPEQTAFREGFEEIGICLHDLELLTTIIKKQSETNLFVARLEEVRPQITLSSEHDAKLWLPGQELLSLDMPEKYKEPIRNHLIGRQALA